MIGLAAVLAGGCDDPAPCGRQAELGRLEAAGAAAISIADVEELKARAGAAGSKMSRSGALIDLLWQEAERLRLNMPGGPQAAVSRRLLVGGHARRILDGKRPPLRSDAEQLPPGAKLTECGRVVLQGAD